MENRKTVQLKLRVRPGFADAVKQAAEQQGLSVSAYIERIILSAINRADGEAPPSGSDVREVQRLAAEWRAKHNDLERMLQETLQTASSLRQKDRELDEQMKAVASQLAAAQELAASYKELAASHERPSTQTRKEAEPQGGPREGQPRIVTAAVARERMIRNSLA